MAFEEKAVRTVIEVFHDGERGFASLSKEIKSPTAKTFFQEEAATRARFANDLESALSAETGKSIQEGGTASGAVHRAWGEIKGKMGGSDHTLFETALLRWLANTTCRTRRTFKPLLTRFLASP